ncbi:hypothetical protein XA68_10812 [Ophiocordyceps unilateralis]|uniref:Uncharacterized protein n=1 Tax=Ophiocordyceps unilateralis TaxID=268505 RepID=A0A2A9PHY8_OPHUN|nr:hypothetical protein XA68_10812 [Ophiocordyceps unilateralis]
MPCSPPLPAEGKLRGHDKASNSHIRRDAIIPLRQVARRNHRTGFFPVLARVVYSRSVLALRLGFCYCPNVSALDLLIGRKLWLSRVGWPLCCKLNNGLHVGVLDDSSRLPPLSKRTLIGTSASVTVEKKHTHTHTY